MLKHLQHPILIESAIGKIDFGVGPKLELPALLRGRWIDARASQSLEMVWTLLRVQNVNGFVTAFQAVLYKREQDAIFFLINVEERADVAGFAELGAGEGNGCWKLLMAYSSVMDICQAVKQESSGDFFSPIDIFGAQSRCARKVCLELPETARAFLIMEPVIIPASTVPPSDTTILPISTFNCNRLSILA